MRTTEVVIDARFCGPEGFGNGGYVSGILGRLASGPAEVTLRNPAPIEKPLTIEEAGGTFRLLYKDKVVADSRPFDGEIEPPPAVAFEAAQSAQDGFTPAAHHNFKCFVCGHRRDEGDGMRLLASPVDHTTVAAPWTPSVSLAASDGKLDPIYLWSALDCPSAFAIGGDVMIMLGRIAAEVHSVPSVGEPCVVVGHRIGAEGRKRFASSAVYTAEGRLCATSRSTWITIPPELWEKMSGRPPGKQR